ncbi:MAG: serine hydrolase [Elusimicrobia bacterium]|nr:serine hydrolase [Elusimicrobiota bacterium]
MKLQTLAVAALALGTGFAIGSWTAGKGARPRATGGLRQGGYRFIHPLLDILDTPEFVDLRPEKQINAEVRRMLRLGLATDIAVYFRDLNNGPWYSIAAEKRFAPASLLKVPILIAVLKQAEGDAGLLQKKLEYLPAGVEEDQTVAAKTPMRLGRWYTVEEFLRAMIWHSDNKAAFALLTHLDPTVLNRTYTELQISVPDPKNPDWISTREMATFFRVLYNASYLDKTSSEKALELLTRTQFQNGLAAGVPSGTTIAHKFGERRFKDRDDVELHDCGIVYYPGNPYILCVMSKGSNLGRLAKAIGNISGSVYREVDRQFQKRRKSGAN